MKNLYKSYTNIDMEYTIEFYGSNRWVNLKYNSKGCYFNHYNKRYYIDDFMFNKVVGNLPEEFVEFDGIINDSFFSGVVVKISTDGEQVKAFTFLCK